MRRTTLRLDEQLFLELKQYAAETGRTFTAVIEDSLRETLARRRSQQAVRRPVQVHTFRGQGLLPGVDLDDSAALLDRMEGR